MRHLFCCPDMAFAVRSDETAHVSCLPQIWVVSDAPRKYFTLKNYADGVGR